MTTTENFGFFNHLLDMKVVLLPFINLLLTFTLITIICKRYSAIVVQWYSSISLQTILAEVAAVYYSSLLGLFLDATDSSDLLYTTTKAAAALYLQ